MGWSRTHTPAVTSEIRRGRCRRRGWEPLTRGIHLQWDATARDRLLAWSLVIPSNAAFTHLTAAAHRGWWLPEEVPHPVFVAAHVNDSEPQRPGLLVSRHNRRLPSELLGGIRVTSAAETLLACARDLSVLDLVIMGDSALRLEQCTVADLEATARERRRGVRRLRQVIPLLDARSESPWESVMRVLHLAADIPVEPQYKVYDPFGRFVARGDLWIVGTRCLHEYDGADHRLKKTHHHDLVREADLVEVGWQRKGFTAGQVLHGGGGIIASADRLLGRSWDSRRLRRWSGLVADSLFGPDGQARATQNWKRAE
jgi:hypothetical protein